MQQQIRLKKPAFRLAVLTLIRVIYTGTCLIITIDLPIVVYMWEKPVVS
jgi:hypothetical protein